jgi:septum formation protein
VKRDPSLFLYSASPRRSELLERLGIPFEVYSLNADETVTPGITPAEAVTEIARRKLDIGIEINEKGTHSWGIAADTMVEGPAGLLGKPENRGQAAQMLSLLSGKTHKVHTGIAVCSPERNGRQDIRCLSHSTAVTFITLSEADIDFYLGTGEWEGAAGAYRIQDRGAFLVKRIEGLWSTVVGLPLSPLYGILSAMSYPFG